MSLKAVLGGKVKGPHKACGEEAFTLVELLIVMVVSLIIIGGLIALMIMVFGHYRTYSNLQAVSDTGRTAMRTIVAQLRGTLRVAEKAPDCTNEKITFWADYSGDYPYAEAKEPSDDGVYNYTRAPKIEVYKSGTNIVQRITEPGQQNPSETSVIGNYVDDLKFYYYPYGITPTWSDLEGDLQRGLRIDPSGTNPRLHELTGLVVVRITVAKGGVRRTFTEYVSLRTYHTEESLP